MNTYALISKWGRVWRRGMDERETSNAIDEVCKLYGDSADYDVIADSQVEREVKRREHPPKLTTRERAKVAAAARWAYERQTARRIYVDEDAAQLLDHMRPSERRRAASDAIRLMLRIR